MLDTPDDDLVATVVALGAIALATGQPAWHTARLAGLNYRITVERTEDDHPSRGGSAALTIRN